MTNFKFANHLGEYAHILTKRLEAGKIDEVKYGRLYRKLGEWMRYNKEAGE